MERKRDPQGQIIPQYAPTPAPLVRPQELGIPRQPTQAQYTATYEIPLPESISRTVIKAAGASTPLLGETSGSILCRAVLVIASILNAGNINVTMKAGGAGQGITLAPGAGLRIPTPDAGNVYFSGAIGDAAEFLIEVAP